MIHEIDQKVLFMYINNSSIYLFTLHSEPLINKLKHFCLTWRMLTENVLCEPHQILSVFLMAMSGPHIWNTRPWYVQNRQVLTWLFCNSGMRTAAQWPCAFYMIVFIKFANGFWKKKKKLFMSLITCSACQKVTRSSRWWSRCEQSFTIFLAVES